MTNEELYQKVRAGDAVAFEQLYGQLEDFIRAIGAEPVLYANRNECCGGYITLEDRTLAVKRASAVTASARAQGAECLITACPLCLYNLRENARDHLEICYFTELLAEALGVKEGGGPQ